MPIAYHIMHTYWKRYQFTLTVNLIEMQLSYKYAWTSHNIYNYRHPIHVSNIILAVNPTVCLKKNVSNRYRASWWQTQSFCEHRFECLLSNRRGISRSIVLVRSRLEEILDIRKLTGIGFRVGLHVNTLVFELLSNCNTINKHLRPSVFVL